MGLVSQGSIVYADWTPLVTSGSFAGIQTDLLTVAAGVLALAVIVFGIGLLVRAL
jgi:hypothetical protein